jgi:endonuclease/exonuclease/phosphatase family metal-dependent hydrolase
MPRVALEAAIRASWGWVRVTTTHLEYYSARQRAAQVARILEINDEAAAHARAAPADRGDGGPFQPQPRPAGGILTGDFNMRPDDPLVEQLRGALRDAWRTAHPGLAQPATFRLASADEAPYCCDYVLVTPDLAPRVRAVRVDAETRASDHQPLLVELG